MSGKNNIFLLWLILLLSIASITIGLLPNKSAKDETAQIDEKINIAAKMQQEGLYQDAINEYEKVLDFPLVSKEKKSNISYIIGKIYFDNKKDYEKAVAYFFRAKFYNPKNSEMNKIEEYTVNSLERLGRSLDAQNKLEEATNLVAEAAPKKYSGQAIAKIGDREITIEELKDKIQQLPEYMQNRYKDDKKTQLEFLKQYVIMELMYDAAKRNGYDKDKDVINDAFEAKKNIMVQKLYKDKIMNTISVSDSDIELYYKANKDKYKEEKQVKLAHILVDSKEKANAIKKRLDAGESFEKLAEKESKDTKTNWNKGVIAYITENGYIPTIGNNEAISSAAFKLKLNEVSEPVKAEDGYHILKVLEIKPASEKPLSEVKQQVEQEVKTQKQQEAQKKYLDQLMSAQKAVVYDNLFEEEKTNSKSESKPETTVNPKPIVLKPTKVDTK